MNSKIKKWRAALVDFGVFYTIFMEYSMKYITLFFVCSLLFSCATTRDYTYFPNGDDKKNYCNETYRYCLDIPIVFDTEKPIPIPNTYKTRGMVASSKEFGYKMIVNGVLFNTKRDPIDKAFFVENVIPISDVEKELGWRFLDQKTDGLSIRDGTAYINKNDKSLRDGYYSYRIRKYNDVGYVELLLEYKKSDDEKIINVIEQLSNSMLLY